MIKWTGRDTSGIWKRTITASNMVDLLEHLVDADIISGYWSPDSQIFHELAYHSKLLSDISERYQAGEEIEEDLDKIDWEEDVFSKLTDKELEAAIRGCDSQAYYQEFEEIED